MYMCMYGVLVNNNKIFICCISTHKSISHRVFVPNFTEICHFLWQTDCCQELKQHPASFASLTSKLPVEPCRDVSMSTTNYPGLITVMCWVIRIF